MNRKIFSGLLASMVIAAGTSSCNNDDNHYEYETTNECLITHVTLGKLQRELHTKSSKGEDSTFYVSVVGAMYPMSIDQRNRNIYNLDSLPVGTDVSKVVFSAVNAIGSYSIKSLETGKDTILALSDSTDFTRPRTLTVVATNGTSKRQYLMKVNVHKEEADSMVWTQKKSTTAAFAQLTNTRSLTIEDKFYIFGRKDGQTKVLTTPIAGYNGNNEAEWNEVATSVNVMPQSVVFFKNEFYGVDEQQRLYISSNGEVWELLDTDFTATTLVVASQQQIVALKGNHFYSSTDARNWKENEVDEIDRMPQQIATGTVIPSSINSQYETHLVVGVKDGKNVVWKREVDLTGNEEYPWIYLPETPMSKYNIPHLQQVSLNTYDGVTLLSGITEDGQVAPLYLSRDNGRTWRTQDIVSPKANGQQALAVTVDKNNFIWMFCGTTGEVWRGRINRLGWTTVPGAFERSRHL